MDGLTTRQHRFVDEYLITGNASKSARLAGFAAKDSDVTGAKLLKNPAVKAEIKRQLDEMHAMNTATAAEILSTLTKIMRGELLEQTALTVGAGRGARVEVVTLPPKIRDRISAASQLLKVLTSADDNLDNELVINIVKAGET